MSEKLCPLRKIWGGGNGLLGNEIRGFIDTELNANSVGGLFLTVDVFKKISSFKVSKTAGSATIPLARYIWQASDHSTISTYNFTIDTDVTISQVPSNAAFLAIWIRAQGGNYAWLEYTVTLNK